MKHIVLVWELGAGLGHIMRLAALAKALQSQEVRISLVLRDLSLLTLVAWPENTRFYQSPLAKSPVNPITAIASYSEVLFTNGFDEIGHLDGLTAAWADLFDLLLPDVIVLDHAPVALLTANMLGLPNIRIGTGFFAPPNELPYPIFRDWEPFDLDRITRVELWLQAMVDRLCDQAQLDKKPFSKWLSPDIDLVSSWPVLDHYAKYRQATSVQYLGNERAVGDIGQALTWKGPYQNKLLVYLKRDYAAINEVLDALYRYQANVIVYIAGCKADEAKALTREHCLVTHQALNLNLMLPEANAFLCHAGSGSVALALEKSVPVVMLPMTAEQLVFAKLVTRLGVGFNLLDSEMSSLKETLHKATTNIDIKNALEILKYEHRAYQEDAIQLAARKIMESLK